MVETVKRAVKKTTAPKDEVKETAVVVPEQQPNLVLAGDPAQQVKYGQKAAKALMDVMRSKPKKVMIQGKQYLEYEDWQTIARFFGATVGIEWTNVLIRSNGDGKKAVAGYEAKANVLLNGQIISSAEAMCMFKEKNWADRDEFMLRSMAQTRASAKALRNVFGWIPVLEGLGATPSEEMPAEIVHHVDQTDSPPPYNHSNEPPQPKPDATPNWHKDNGGGSGLCSFDGCDTKLAANVKEYSMNKYGKELCYDHQKT